MSRERALLATRCWLVCALLAGCGEEPPSQGPTNPPAPTGTWACPAGWVATARGGCGPSVLLCAPGGGAAVGACDRVDLAHPLPLPLSDGGVVQGFRRLPDGGIGGAWPELDDPAEPRRAGIAACLDGWRRLDDGTCDPALRSDCPPGSAALPGGACTPTSELDCPAGEYADPGVEALGARVVHVRAGADPVAADGSAERPYADIEDSIVRAGSGAWVLLARGVYHERPLATGTAVHVVGVCAARTIIEGITPSEGAAPTFNARSAGTDVTLRNVTLRGTGYGLQAHSGATLRVSGAVIEDSGGAGVFARGAGTRLELSRSVVRGTRPRLPFASGVGLLADQGASVRLSEVVFDGNSRVSLRVDGSGTAAWVSSCVIRGTRPDAMGTYGVGLIVQQGGRLDATGLLLDDNRQTGVNVVGAGSEVTLASTIVRGTRPSPSASVGNGVEVIEGATLRATDLLVDDNVGVGVLTDHRGSAVELASSVVRRTRLSHLGNGGYGLSAGSGATLRTVGVLIDRSTTLGVLAHGHGTVVDLRASVVRGTRPDLMARYGYGVVAREGAVLRATGVAIDANASAGALVGVDGAALELTGSAIRGTRVEGRGTYGRAVEVATGGALRAEAVLLADNGEAAVWAAGSDARVDARDLVIDGVRSTAGGFGVGLYATLQARIEGLRVSVVSVGGAAVVALPYEGHPSRIRLDDLFVREVRPSTIQIDDQGGIGFPAGPAVSYGLHAGPGCAIEAARAVIDVSDYGIFNASGVVRLRVGVISRQRQALGAFDLGAGADATTLDGVSSRDNLVEVLVRRDDLPVASSLAAPEDPCADGC